jgi:signal peptidase I
MTDETRPPLAGDAAAREAHEARSGKLAEQFKEGAKTILGALLIALVLRSFIFEPFNIPSGSMLPRLLVGDYLFVAKWPYGYSRYSFPLGLPPFEGRIPAGHGPERGDVVVFKGPRDNRTDFIKRVVGLPGDQIQMRGGQLFINGEAVPKRRVEDFVVPVDRDFDCQGFPRLPSHRVDGSDGRPLCRFAQYEETLPGGRTYRVLDQAAGVMMADDTEVFLVPDGHYFVMGDNRDDSADSRFPPFGPQPGVGFVPAQNLVGRASLMFFSIDGTARWWAPWTWPGAIRFERIGERFS